MGWDGWDGIKWVGIREVKNRKGEVTIVSALTYCSCLSSCWCW